MSTSPQADHTPTTESVARAQAQQRADRLAAGVDLETGQPVSDIERTIEDAQRAHRQPLPPMPRPLVTVCAWCADAPEQMASARAHGHEVTHSICKACRNKFESGAPCR